MHILGDINGAKYLLISCFNPEPMIIFVVLLVSEFSFDFFDLAPVSESSQSSWLCAFAKDT